jgi:hypothetical protein
MTRDDEISAINEFIATRGVTLCPAAFPERITGMDNERGAWMDSRPLSMQRKHGDEAVAEWRDQAWKQLRRKF